MHAKKGYAKRGHKGTHAHTTWRHALAPKGHHNILMSFKRLKWPIRPNKIVYLSGWSRMKRSQKQGKYMLWREMMAFICWWHRWWERGPWGRGLRALSCLGQKPICEDSAGVMKCWENVLLVLKICSILLPMSRPTNVGYEVVSRNYMLILQHWAGSWIQIREGIYSSWLH